MIVNGRFRVTGAISDPEFCNFGFSANGIRDYYFGFFLERGSFTIEVDKNALNDMSIVYAGSPVEMVFRQFQRRVKHFQGHYYPESVNLRLEEMAASSALKHPGSFVSAFALFSYGNDPGKLSKIYRRLAPQVQASYYGRMIRDKLAHKVWICNHIFNKQNAVNVHLCHGKSF